MHYSCISIQNVHYMHSTCMCQAICMTRCLQCCAKQLLMYVADKNILNTNTNRDITKRCMFTGTQHVFDNPMQLSTLSFVVSHKCSEVNSLVSNRTPCNNQVFLSTALNWLISSWSSLISAARMFSDILAGFTVFGITTMLRCKAKARQICVGSAEFCCWVYLRWRCSMS